MRVIMTSGLKHIMTLCVFHPECGAFFAFSFFSAHQVVPGPRCATLSPTHPPTHPALPLSRQAVRFSCPRTPYQMSSSTTSLATHPHSACELQESLSFGASCQPCVSAYSLNSVPCSGAPSPRCQNFRK